MPTSRELLQNLTNQASGIFSSLPSAPQGPPGPTTPTGGLPQGYGKAFADWSKLFPEFYDTAMQEAQNRAGGVMDVGHLQKFMAENSGNLLGGYGNQIENALLSLLPYSQLFYPQQPQQGAGGNTGLPNPFGAGSGGGGTGLNPIIKNAGLQPIDFNEQWRKNELARRGIDPYTGQPTFIPLQHGEMNYDAEGDGDTSSSEWGGLGGFDWSQLFPSEGYRLTNEYSGGGNRSSRSGGMNPNQFAGGSQGYTMGDYSI